MNRLLVSVLGGCMGLVLLFAFCFFAVHIRLFSKKERKDPPPPEPPPTEPEPVYYIVERKRKRAKDSFSDPKRIDFK
ncbi:MAG: hypothetical protein IJY11_01445 [Clostridia bacterium]|nr:hypothetical protein [Clostridia bacterium]